MDRSPARFVDRVRAALAADEPLPAIAGAQVEPAELTPGEAAAARVDAAFPNGQPVTDAAAAGVPTPPAPAAAAPPAEFDLFADNAIENLDLGNVPYQQGAQLAKDIARTRDRLKPLHEVLGGLSPEEQTAVLTNAKQLGGDLAGLTSTFSRLHPQDRAFFIDALGMLADPATQADGAAMLESGVTQLNQALGRGTLPLPGTPAPPAAGEEPDPFAGDPADEPMTRAQFEEWQRNHEFQTEMRTQEQQVLSEMRELGYDPESQDPAMEAQVHALIGLAGRSDINGDIGKAHEALQGWRQAIIDEFVAAKAQGADRPGVSVDSGAPPVAVVTNETLDDAEAAMRARLDGVFGPDARRRSADD